MKKILSLVLVLAMVVIAGGAFAEEKITLNVAFVTGPDGEELEFFRIV